MFSGVPIQRLHSKTECVTAVQLKAVPIQIFIPMQPFVSQAIKDTKNGSLAAHTFFEREREK